MSQPAIGQPRGLAPEARILVVHNDYQQAGGERVAVRAQIDLLRAFGHEPLLYWRDSAAINDFSALQKAAFFPRTIYDPSVYREVTDLVRRERVSVAHVHNVFPLISPAVYRALHDEGVPIVQTLHNFRFLCPNGLFYTRGQVCERCKGGNTLHAVRLRCFRDSYALSALYAAAIAVHRRMGTFGLIDRYLALTEFGRRKLIESGLVGADRVSVLGNFLPQELPELAARRRHSPYVLYMGRLSQEKGPGMLIEAMALVPELELKVLGEGPELAPLRARAAQLGLTKVAFLGHVTGPAKWALLQEALATVVPSMCYETFSVTALESLASGTPVVASAIGSLPALVEPGRSGWLVPPGDVGALGATLRAVLSERAEAERMGRLAADQVRERYGPRSHYNALMGTYAEVVAARRRALPSVRHR